MESGAPDGYQLEDGSGVLLLEQDDSTSSAFIPIISRTLSELREDALLVQPQVFRFPFRTPAIQFIPFRNRVLSELSVSPRLVFPQFFPLVTFVPAAPAPANPVIGYRMRRLEELSRPIQIPIAQFFPFPYVSVEEVAPGVYVWHVTRRNQRL